MTQTSTPVEVRLSFVRTGESPETIFSEERRQCGRANYPGDRCQAPALPLPPDNFDRYDFGSGRYVGNRLR